MGREAAEAMRAASVAAAVRSVDRVAAAEGWAGAETPGWVEEGRGGVEAVERMAGWADVEG